MNVKNRILNDTKWLNLKQPLFYNTPNGLRFEIGNPKYSLRSKEYFQSAMHRASSLFDALFSNEAYLHIIIDADRLKDENMNWEVPGEIKECIAHKDLVYDYDILPNSDGEEEYITIRTYLKLRKSDLDHMELLRRITRCDMGSDAGVRITDKVYILNESCNTIYLYYDDRGADVVSEHIEYIRPLYNEYKSWLLDYDRKDIVEKFQASRVGAENEEK